MKEKEKAQSDGIRKFFFFEKEKRTSCGCLGRVSKHLLYMQSWTWKKSENPSFGSETERKDVSACLYKYLLVQACLYD